MPRAAALPAAESTAPPVRPAAPWRGPALNAALGMAASVAVLLYANALWRDWVAFSPFSDFFAIRSWAAMLHAAADPTALYAPERVQAFLNAEVAHFPHRYPFAYPPSFLLAIWPLGVLPARVGAVLWMLGGLGLYALLPTEALWRRASVFWLLVLPGTVLTAIGGQDGLFVAALLAGGCQLLGRRPVLAGVLFGLAACKPQFGVLVPLALIAARQWRAIAAAVTVLAMVMASGLAFGFALWAAWPRALLGLAGYAAGRARLVPLMPTVSATLRLLHLSPGLVLAAQLVAAAVAAAAVFRVWRGGPSRAASAVLLVGAFLVTPYAFFYDLPILNAGLLFFVLDRRARGGRLEGTEWAVLALAALLPVAMDAGAIWPVAALPYALAVVPAAFAMVARSDPKRAG